MAAPSLRSGRRGRAARLAAAALATMACSLCSQCTGFVAGGRLSRPPAASARARVQVAATATDTFDPWTVLGISPEAPPNEARKAYKKLIAKYHPDVDPSAEAEVKFQQAVRAHAVITGEDRDLDTNALLKNAVENLRNNLEFKKQQIEKLRAEAAAEEAEMERMAEQLEVAKVKREKVTQELGVAGGAALGFLAGGPAGLVLGAVVGLAVRERDDAMGQVVRGAGTVAKGVVEAVGKAASKVG